MKKLFLFYYPFLLFMLQLPCTMSFSQNVGVGTTAPNARLEIKDTANTKVKITSKSYVDTSQLILSNRLGDVYGTDMILSSNQEQGIRVIARSDLPNNNSDSILMITPSGRLGINKPGLPAYTLDVNGDINTAGALRINGNQGSSGQVLRSNGNGTMSWGNLDDYPNLATFANTGANTWTVPAGVTKILVEVWGAGGGGNIYAGGGGGGYVKALITVVPSGSVSMTVGASGPGSTNTATNGGTTTLSYSPVTITANGGYGANFTGPSTVSSGGGGNFIVLGTNSYTGMYGQKGQPIKHEFTQTTGSVFYEIVNGGYGGNGGNADNTGGEPPYAISKVTAPVAIVKTQFGGFGLQPGGGGGSGYSFVTGGLGFGNGSDGASGMVIIHY